MSFSLLVNFFSKTLLKIIIVKTNRVLSFYRIVPLADNAQTAIGHTVYNTL